MNDNLRYLLAGVLIFIIILLQPIYLDWLGLNTPTETSLAPDDPLEKISERSYVPPVLENNTENNYNNFKNNTPEHLITFVSPLYTTTISNRSGGTIKNHTLTQINEGRYKYGGGYDDDAFYNQDLPVSLLYPGGEDYCHPCLSIYNNNEYELLDDFFTLNSNFSHGDTVLLNLEDQVSLHYSLRDSNNEISITSDDVTVAYRGALDENANLRIRNAALQRTILDLQSKLQSNETVEEPNNADG